MRGKAGQIQSQTPELGITPAYAGKRFNQRSMLEQMGDHPRVCGEKKNLRAKMVHRWGSPPRMRGKVK